MLCFQNVYALLQFFYVPLAYTVSCPQPSDNDLAGSLYNNNDGEEHEKVHDDLLLGFCGHTLERDSTRLYAKTAQPLGEFSGVSLYGVEPPIAGVDVQAPTGEHRGSLDGRP